MRVICVCTGNKYSQWYVDNLKHMIDNYSGLEYDEFVSITDDVYEGVFNKLLMFDRYRDGQNIYFDLDVVITDDCNHFLREEFTLCEAWWRPALHTPLNSSIVSWYGDRSSIYNLFESDPEYYMLRYNKGIDQLIYENVEYLTYTKQDRYCSYYTNKSEGNYSVYLYNQHHEVMLQPGWHRHYTIHQ